jgi:hypothetical protein
MVSSMGYPTGKQTCASTGMGKNLNPHAGMGFLRVKLELTGAGMERHYRFLLVGVSTCSVSKEIHVHGRCKKALGSVKKHTHIKV